MVIGMTTFSQILAANGDWFQLNTGCPGTPQISFQGNVFELTGVPAIAGEAFVTFGGGASLNHEYAVTDIGRVFRWRADCGWVYAGSLPIGAIQVNGESWGTLKARYR